MRPYLVIAIATVLVVGFAAKMSFFPGHSAEASSTAWTTAHMDIFEMHRHHPAIKDLPEQTVKEPF